MNPEIFLESIKRARLDLFAAQSIRSPSDFPRVNECIDSAHATLVTIIETLAAEKIAARWSATPEVVRIDHVRAKS